jgi:Mg2+/Co2+ transporter CorC
MDKLLTFLDHWRDIIGGLICRVFGHVPTPIHVEDQPIGWLCFRCGAGEADRLDPEHFQ